MKNFEKIYALFALLYMARGVVPLVAGQGDQTQVPQFDLLTFILQAAVFAILAVLIFVHWQSIIAGVRGSGWLFALCALAILSAGWSAEPLFSFRRAIILLATTMFGIFIASRFDLDEQQGLFGWLAALSIIGSFMMAILFPQYGISNDIHAGDWKGLFPHKNALGQQMAFGILVLAIGRPKGLPKGILWCCLLGAGLLLLLSRSATSIAVVAAIAALYATLHLLRLRRRKTLPLWLVFTPLISFAILAIAASSQFFLSALGRDSTLTGRTVIWSAVLDAIRERPLLGYGYAVFWRNGLQGDARDVLNAIHWTGLMQAQSGYLDLCLDLGSIGLVVFLGGLCAAGWRGLRLFRSGSTQAAKWPLVFLVFFLLYNFVESSLLQLYTFLWVPYVSTFVSLALLQTAEHPKYQFYEQGAAGAPNTGGPSEGDGLWVGA
jgi:exopolysaccharide production protein ExoQ